MKKIILLLLLVLCFSISGFTQTKLDEYGKLMPDAEYCHLSYLADYLKQNSTSSALITVYAPDDVRVGSFVRYFYGIGEALQRFVISPDRFVLHFGGTSRDRRTELWVLKLGDRSPGTENKTLDDLISRPIRGRTQFDRECLDCDRSPFIDQMIFGNGLDHLAKTLLMDRSLSAEILIGRVPYLTKTKKDQSQLRDKIITKLSAENTIAKNRIKIKFI